MRLRCGYRTLDLSTPAVMGVLNVTPDSFSDGGCWLHVDDALRRAEAMVAEGAAILDIGGESTRPGAAPVPVQQELDRVIPVIERLAASVDVVLSVDTQKPQVMQAALAVGVGMVNDVNALREPGALDCVAGSAAAVSLMHMQGLPRSMQQAPRYTDVVGEVMDVLGQRVEACLAAGIAPDRLVVDPGIGFGKTLEHNLALLCALDTLGQWGVPVMVGVSRKSMFGQLLGLDVADRLIPSVVAAALAVDRGARIIRAHDVRATVQSVTTAHAIRRGRVIANSGST